MGDAWFTGCPDELARLLLDARACAERCEAHLAERPDSIDLLAAPAAVSRVLIELIDQPAELLLAAAHLCRELTTAAAQHLHGPADLVDSLQRVADSATALLDATG